jgi:hypothetical protein
VPSLTGVRRNDAADVWVANGFTRGNLSSTGNGNYFVGTQSLAGGLLNPAGGCTGATIVVGP